MTELLWLSKEQLRKDYRQKRANCSLSLDLLSDLYENLLTVICEEVPLVYGSGKDSAESVQKVPQNLGSPQQILVASYKSFGSEIIIDGWTGQKVKQAIQALESEKNFEIKFCYPRISGDNIELFCVEKEDSQVDCFETNSFGILEPKKKENQQVNVADCQAVLVPGLVFHRSGHRLGYGRGFYDRLLAEYTGLKIGVAFADQVTSDFWEVQSKDISMDYIVTEKYILNIRVEA